MNNIKMSVLETGCYCIVEFEDGGIQIVPRNWISKSEAFWPNFKSYTKYYRAVEMMIQPDTDHWDLHSIKRIMYSTDDFHFGVEKLKDAEEFSDLNDAASSRIKSRKIRARIMSSSSDSDEKSVSNANVAVRKKLFKGKRDSFESVPELSYNFPTPPDILFEKSANSRVALPEIVQPDQSSLTSNLSSSAISNKDVELTYLKDIHRKIGLTLLNQRQILERIENMEKHLLGISNNNISSTDEDWYNNFELEWGHLFPIKSAADMSLVNDKLKEEDFKKYLVRKCKFSVGRDAKDTIINILKSMLSNQIAVQYSFLGARKKEGFKELKILEVIEAVVRGQKGQEMTTNNDIYCHIKNWLRQAQLRLDREIMIKL